MYSPPDTQKNLQDKAKSLFQLFPQVKEEVKGIVWDEEDDSVKLEVKEQANG